MPQTGYTLAVASGPRLFHHRYEHLPDRHLRSVPAHHLWDRMSTAIQLVKVPTNCRVL